MWDARRILKEIADAASRRRILAAFWKHSDKPTRAMTTAHLAKLLHFREESIKKMPADKKADLLTGRIGLAEFDQPLEMGLMLYHTHEANSMMGSFLDAWGITHQNGEIEENEQKAPTSEQVRDAVRDLGQFQKRDVALYLATAGLLMGEDWRNATWPVVDELVPTLATK